MLFIRQLQPKQASEICASLDMVYSNLVRCSSDLSKGASRAAAASKTLQSVANEQLLHLCVE